MGGCLCATEPGSPQPTSASPFLRLREAPLAYHGPSDDFTNLTEVRLGWFGPTNLDDPLTGDLWWAANLAIREANEQRAAPTEHGVHAASPSEVADALESPDPPSAGAVKRPEGRAPAPSSDASCVMRHASFHALPFRLVPRWAVDPWGTGVSQLTRMVYDEQPLALLGSVDSASTHLAEQVVAKANLPLVSPMATDKSVTLAGVPWMFSCAPSDAAIARVLVDDILAMMQDGASSPARGSRRDEAPTEKSAIRNPQSTIVQSLLTSAATSEKAGLALLACTDHESRLTTREVLKEFSRRGRLPDFRFDVPPGAAVIRQQMSALEASRPAAVLVVAGADDAALLVQAVKERVPAAALFGSQSCGRQRFLQRAGLAAEGVRFPLLFVPVAADTNTDRFTGRFIAERHRPPDYSAALTYEATRLLIEAIRRAGPNRARIREALTQLSPWSSIAGPIHFDGTGQNTGTNIRLGTIRDGSVIPLAPRERLNHSEL